MQAFGRTLDGNAVQRARIASLHSTSCGRYRREYGQYCAIIAQQQGGVSPSPVTGEKLATYIVERVRACGSATSAEQWLSQVVGYAERFDTVRISYEGRQLLRQVLSGLGNLYGRSSTQRPPIRGYMLRLVGARAAAAIAANPFLELVWSHTLVAYRFLLRPNEFTGETRARLCDLIQGPSEQGRVAMTLRLFDTKGTRRLHLGKDAEETTFGYAMPGDALDFAAPLARWVQRYAMEGTDLLFPGWDSIARRPSQETITADAYNKGLKRLLRLAGFEGFSAQGLRAGRRTDLTEAGVRERTIMRLGRWHSESSSERYNRLTPAVLRGTAGA